MTTWFTADTHFGHATIIRHCGRPFLNVLEHDAALIANWNTTVADNDVVYHLGDFGFNKARLVWILSQLRGKIFFVRGNHDKAMKGEALSFVEDLGIYYELTINRRLIVLCHYPFHSWSGSCRGSWHLHGHSHGKTPSFDVLRMDVGVDCNDYSPVAYEKVCRYMERTPCRNRVCR